MPATDAPRTAAARSALRGALALALLAPAPGALAQTGPAVPEGRPSAPSGTIVARDVVVAEGETLREIARRELGRAGYAPQLAEFNQIGSSFPLAPGQLVRVPVHVPARGEVALVVFAKGEVTLDGAPLRDDAEIGPGAVIETGADGFLSLEFASGTVVNLQPGSLVTLARLNCLEGDDSCLIELDAARGDLTSDVESREGQPAEFRVTTPEASAAVRGTVFDVLSEGEALALAVTEGAVAVAAAGEEVAVPEGFGSVTRAGEAPGEPRPLLPAPVFRSVPPRLVPGDLVAWWELTDVAGWAATLSLDGAGVETVAEVDLGDAADAVDLAARIELEPGDYTFNLRGVDPDGIPGYRAQTRVTLAAVDDAAAAPTVTVVPEGREFLVAVDGADGETPGYEIQISRTPDFRDPLAVDVGPPGAAVFRIDADVVHARARALFDPFRVSAFGPTASSDP